MAVTSTALCARNRLVPDIYHTPTATTNIVLGRRILHSHWRRMRRNPHPHHPRHVRLPFRESSTLAADAPAARQEALHQLRHPILAAAETITLDALILRFHTFRMYIFSFLNVAA